ncbi:dimethylsulfoxide reductase [Pseudonocardia sulfidoxydans NBRC 16205]|uniref:Dimethylsulfoxide reductase n=1 Tax=Pseudonocardia sulfidoxydans NBRC 16205 TaxID=1223511 RepID=A0A511DF99_9PSEU|nr:molybdopterin-dependent oxidoreductase [Pseudonocardia sulfidoxydans]GEL23466.1 dimethylsulfoxide reductase [Pseudonocardia sulfidoxydans NBRC 16205]
MPSSAPHEVPTAGHFGTYLAETDGTRVLGLRPDPADPEPSPIGLGVPSSLTAPSRLTAPYVRRGYLEHGPGPAGGKRGVRGRDTYVRVDWDTAVSLTADALRDTIDVHGNAAVFGGSYGWGSAGRFHHPQSQIHRFLNLLGGYTRSVESYSSAAMQVILRRVGGGYAAGLASNPIWREIGEQRSLVVAFGGLPGRNTQVNGGGIGRHTNLRDQRRAREQGAEFVSISPLRTDIDDALDATRLPARPGTDVAIMLALAHELVVAGAHDVDFLQRCTVGWNRFEDYLLGRSDGIPKTPAWAAPISGLPAGDIGDLARRMRGRRTVITTSYSLQRADHGEQAPWMALTLAAISGSLGRPGGGFGAALGALHQLGLEQSRFHPAALPQGLRRIDSFIPVARIADMLLHPGEQFDYDGGRHTYPDARLLYWVGGNPFHHHQDLNRLVRAWQRPDTVVVHEHFANALARHADIVLPAATWLERDDFAAGAADPYVSAMVRAAQPPPGVRTDHTILAAVADKLGIADEFTEGRSEQEWVEHLYEQTRDRAARLGATLPTLDELRRVGTVALPQPPRTVAPYTALRADPAANPIATPSGRIEIFSDTIAGFGLPGCPGHPTWLEPKEWLGAPAAVTYPLHLVSGQPERRLHSQFDNGSHSSAGKVAGREPVLLNPVDAAARGIVDGAVVRIHNARGACLAGAVVSDAIRPGVARLSTGAWYDPSGPDGLDVHGNPNVLTGDRGTSPLAQGPSAHSCLVDIERFEGEPPRVTVFDPLPTAP